MYNIHSSLFLLLAIYIKNEFLFTFNYKHPPPTRYCLKYMKKSNVTLNVNNNLNMQ